MTTSVLAPPDPTHLQIYAWSQLTAPTPLTSGTTSTIYRATLHGLPVAVKLLKPLSTIDDPSTRSRAAADLENEIRVNAVLRHPNIVLFLGVVNSELGRGLVFEYAGGGGLDVTTYGIGKLRDVVDVCVGVGRALAFAHGLSILHRDVKPSQVVLDHGVPKLGDWGLATVCGTDMSGETGTWEYMAPEVVRSEYYDTSADVFSFGMLLYTLLTARKYPYETLYLLPAQAALGVAKRQLRPPLSARIPKPVADIVIKCWAGNARDRPDIATVVHMLLTIERGLEKPAEASQGAGYFSWLWE